MGTKSFVVFYDVFKQAGKVGALRKKVERIRNEGEDVPASLEKELNQAIVRLKELENLVLQENSLIL